MFEKWNKVKEKIKESKGLRIAIIALLVLVVLLIYFTSFGKKEKTTLIPPNESTVNYTRAQQEALSSTISMIKGVGKVKSYVNFESSPEIIIAYITSISGTNETNTPQIQMVDGSQIPLILKTNYPKALGCIIVAEGAANIKIKLQILEAASTALGIPIGLINVYPM